MTDNLDCKNDVLYIGKYKVPFDALVWLLDTIDKMKETEIVDVDVCGNDVICTFADGEKQTAHCHPEDEERWSLETGISVCLGKYLMGGSSAYNRIIRHGVNAFNRRVRAEADEIEAIIEKERIRENKRRKRERYLKRRAERQAAECAECDAREYFDGRKDTNNGKDSSEEKKKISVIDVINAIAKDFGIEIELVTE